MPDCQEYVKVRERFWQFRLILSFRALNGGIAMALPRHRASESGKIGNN
jgi:hypothetical protein